MSAEVASSRVTITAQPLWRIRIARELPRHLVSLAALVGLVASARFAIAPPRPAARLAPSRGLPLADPAAQGYAVLFARRYLTWDSSRPASSGEALAPFAGTTEGLGLTLPSTGSQHVQWAEAVQVREPLVGVHTYTVAAETDAGGLLYLTVAVERAPDGSLRLDGYPAFVGAPAAEAGAVPPGGREVADHSLVTVLGRALRNYLAGSAGELAADLSPAARVSLPSYALTLESIAQLGWTPDGRSVRAVVQAQDPRGARYTLAYELDVVRSQGRWEIAAVQTDPDS